MFKLLKDINKKETRIEQSHLEGKVRANDIKRERERERERERKIKVNLNSDTQ